MLYFNQVVVTLGVGPKLIVGATGRRMLGGIDDNPGKPVREIDGGAMEEAV